MAWANLARLPSSAVIKPSPSSSDSCIACEYGRGRLIISWIAAEMPAPFEAVYGASKAFVLSFAEELRNELKHTSVSVTALQPGPTDTNFFNRADMLDTKVGADKKGDPTDVARDAQVTPDKVTAEMHRKLSEPGSTSKLKDRDREANP
ncbi:MAG TPA: SDR family NAD(P)-dependent oxidoreductase [Gemmatimonadaceae bacterium]|nr:SDR family NAD(P)-dependent oxidoreductase [Gemmatimonadaceae bacterium]